MNSTSYRLTALLTLLAFAGCDGRPDLPFEPAPPAPQRYSIEITTSSGARAATVQLGDTVVLTAAVRNQAGTIVNTGTVDWRLNILSGPPKETPLEMLGYLFSLEPTGSRTVRVIGHVVGVVHVSGAAMGVGASYPISVI